MTRPGNRPQRTLGVTTWVFLIGLALILFFADEIGSLLPLPTQVAVETSPATTSDQRAAEVVDPAAEPALRFSDLPTIQFADLPPEAQQTLLLIERNGPFPYSKDGSTFQNRERLLPLRGSGHYREYTVITPGSPDRGARRIVAGDDGERYYTDDHYDSFREVIDQ